MKTLNEIKDKVAEQSGYENWDLLLYAFAGFGSQIQPYNDEVAKLYAEEALKAAAEIPSCYTNIDETLEEKSKIRNLIKELK